MLGLEAEALVPGPLDRESARYCSLGLIRSRQRMFKGESMDSPTSLLLIIVLFVVRLGIPILIVLAVGYALSRLDAYWQSQADKLAPPEPMASGQNPHTLPAAASRPAPALRLSVSDRAGLPCWSLKGCSEAVKATCAARHQPHKPCWQARWVAEGRLPGECRDCNLYVASQEVIGGGQYVH